MLASGGAPSPAPRSPHPTATMRSANCAECQTAGAEPGPAQATATQPLGNASMPTTAMQGVWPGGAAPRPAQAQQPALEELALARVIGQHQRVGIGPPGLGEAPEP